MLIGALCSSTIVLMTPGTVFTSQAVEPYIAAVVALFSSNLPARGRIGSLVVAALLVWVAARDVREIRNGIGQRPPAIEASMRAVADCPDPVLSESPLVPALANRSTVLLDPFAFKVVALHDSRLSDELIRRLQQREFTCVVLGEDPDSAAGRGWYRNMALGEPVMDAIRANYRLRLVQSGYRTYVPARR